MKLKAFLGCAGTGKTTAVFNEVVQALQRTPPGEGQRLLAITRMNGARKRLEGKLREGAVSTPFDCRTIDSFAWMVAARWRAKGAALGLQLPTDADYDETCGAAAALLSEPDVGCWIATAFPIVVVDEFQDCQNDRLRLIQRIAAWCDVYVAADEFQNLDGGASPAVSWLREHADVVELGKVHRTNKSGLLTAATCIRAGRDLTQGWGRPSGFSLVDCMNPNVAAGFVSRGIKWKRDRELVVLSPTGPGASTFVRRTLERLAEKAFIDRKSRQSFGPYTVLWEATAEQAKSDLLAAAQSQTYRDSHLPGGRELGEWTERQRSLRGKTEFTPTEWEQAAARAVQLHRAHARPTRRIRGMTIHQAKNQEFDSVIVLWPVEMKGDRDKLARLLYNAVTRAKSDAVVIVQNINHALDRPPFSGIL